MPQTLIEVMVSQCSHDSTAVVYSDDIYEDCEADNILDVVFEDDG